MKPYKKCGFSFCIFYVVNDFFIKSLSFLNNFLRTFLYYVGIIILTFIIMFKFKNIFCKSVLGSLFFSVCFFLLSFISPMYAHADTHITNDNTRYGGHWTKAGSPYILDGDIRLSKNQILSIDAGVSVMSASTTNWLGQHPGVTLENGQLYMNGTLEDPIKLYDMGIIYSYFSTTSMSNVIAINIGFNFWKSTSTISHLIQNHAQSYGILAIESNIEIKNSKLLNNTTYGVEADAYKPLVFIDGNGNPVTSTSTTFPHLSNVFSIKDSDIAGNIQGGINNGTIYPIEAENNWWGSVNGPTTNVSGNGDKVSGLVNFTPWRDKPIADEKPCCSNVLFLPGIESSRLYKDSSGILGGIFGTSTNTLWEPNRNADVEKMYLDSNGKSLDSTIYTSDILDSAYYGLKNIYKSFITMMNGVVADKTINQWLPFPYDWRTSVYDVANGQTQLSTTTISLINSVEKLALNSKTGKVTIITHSNGGLVAKELQKALETKGESNLIDKVINIAVPELGTPQAILGMLNGYDQSIAGGLILSENTARTLSQNMPSAYGLLPSQKFFENNPIKIISDMFSSGTNIVASSYDAMKKFLLSNPFSVASSSDTNIPLLLNSSLLSSAENIHTAIDSWKPASTTKIISFVGWGVPTSEGIQYEKYKHCDTSSKTKCAVAFSPILSDDGDGTVSTESNASTSDQISFFNLKKLNKDTREKINHANILESTELLAKVRDNIASTSSSSPSFEKYFSQTKPVDTDKYLTIKIYSPVDIDLYDKDGNHTGPIDNPVVGKDLEAYENNIPGSYYGDFGNIKMVRVPYDVNDQISLNGNNTGVFSADAQITQSDQVIASTTFGDLPVTSLMSANLVIPTSTESFATSTSMLIDVDGDGTTDFVNHSDEFLKLNATSTATSTKADLLTYIESMKKVIISLKLKPKDEKIWLDRIDRIVSILNKKHLRNVEIITRRLSLRKIRSKTLTENQKTVILQVFESLLTRIETENK